MLTDLWQAAGPHWAPTNRRRRRLPTFGSRSPDIDPSRPTQPALGRIAPSPTGLLHVGHARTFLVAWLSVRAAGGRVALRIEDIDASRVRPGMAEQAMLDLSRLGLDWDEGPDRGGPAGEYTQSRRLDHHRAALEYLKAQNLVYPCTCTRAEIERAASAPHAGDEGPAYPGTCARRTPADAAALAMPNFAWRFRAPAGPIDWIDRFQGKQSLDLARTSGDFVVWREGSGPAYQLAVVCDDAAMHVTEVIRGADLIPSTPRQIALYRALGSRIPEFGHVPLVHGQAGVRLAKRDNALALKTLFAGGIEPGRILSFLAHSIGIVGAGERPTATEMIARFDPLCLPKSPITLPNEWTTP